MFTGIIETIGTVRNLVRQSSSLSLTIEAKDICCDLGVGHSVAVNGVCLTVVARQSHGFAVQAVEESLYRTTLGRIRAQDQVNLERALLPTQRLGGHILTGHIDGIGILRFREDRQSSTLWSVELPDQLLTYCVRQGSIGVDGISLTIADIVGQKIVISVIPHTRKTTTFGFRRVADEVNIEVDIIGKYVEQFMGQKKAGLTEISLREQGY